MAFLKSLVPTDRIFQVGLHMHGACHLTSPWNGDIDAASERGAGGGRGGNTSVFYYSKTDAERNGVSHDAGSGEEVDFSFTHPFDATVWAGDAKLLDPSSLGVIYHFQINRRYLSSSNFSTTRTFGQNEYARRFFPNVLRELNRRGLVLPEFFPSSIYKNLLFKERPDLYIPYTPYMLTYLNGRDIFP
jgi:hypothetical protein